MRPLAAIALASEPADEKVLEDKPRNRKEFIINKPLAKAIFGFGGLIFLICTFVLWSMNKNIPYISEIDTTMFFAGYMVLNWWNLFNARVIGKNKSVFSGLFNNSKFYGVTFGILVTTWLIVQFGGEVFRTHPLSWETWGMILLVTSPVLIIRELYFQLFGKKKSN